MTKDGDGTTLQEILEDQARGTKIGKLIQINVFTKPEDVNEVVQVLNDLDAVFGYKIEEEEEE
jgi:hypothetical protein